MLILQILILELFLNGFTISTKSQETRKLKSGNIKVDPIVEPDNLTCSGDKNISILSVSQCRSTKCQESEWSKWTQRSKIMRVCKECDRKRKCDLDDVFNSSATFHGVKMLRINFECIPDDSVFEKKTETPYRPDTEIVVSLKSFEDLAKQHSRKHHYCRKNSKKKLPSKESTLNTITDVFTTSEKNISVYVRANTNDSENVILTAKAFHLPSSKVQHFLPQPAHLDTERTTLSQLLYPNQTYVSVLGFDSNNDEPANLTVKFSYQIIHPKKLHEQVKTIKNSISKKRRTYTQSASLVCVFVNTTEKKFSENGCVSISSPDLKNATCECNHATVFTLLLTVVLITVPEVVEVLSYITETISIVSLIVAFFVLVYLREKIKNKRLHIQLNLIAAVAFLHIVSLLEDVSLRHTLSCEVSTVALHFFVLATGCWMLMEGLNLFLINSKQSLKFVGMYRQRVVYFSYFVGWVIPFVIVTISAVIGIPNSNYVEESTDVEQKVFGEPKYQVCWLSIKHGMRMGAAIIPIAFVIIANTMVAFHTAFVVVKMKRVDSKRLSVSSRGNRKSSINEVKYGLQTLLLLTPTFGLSWILMLLTNSPGKSSLVFLYLNAIFNGLQGFCIALIYCGTRKVRCALQISIRKKI